MEMTATQMIDIASMKAIYGHLQNDENIQMAFQVIGEERDLAEIGQWMIEGDVANFIKALREQRLKPYTTTEIPITNAIYCLYLPPYYVFVDLKRKYE